MMQASTYGRLAADPRSIETKSGKPMATCRLAVHLDREDEAPLWLGLVAFGRLADELMRHGKGELVSVSGRIQRNTWTDRQTGEIREQLQLLADSLISARTVRPSGGRKRAAAEVRQ